MSTRALRKLYGSNEKDELEVEKLQEKEENESSEEEEEVVMACTNKFLLLEDGEDDAKVSSESESEQNQNDKSPKVAPSTKKKKRKKKKKKGNNNSNNEKSEATVDDEFDKALEELSEMSKSKKITNQRSTKKQPTKSVLQVEHKFLNIYNELQKIFGSQVLKRDADYKRRHKGMTSHRGVWLTQPAENWTKMIRVGLSMDLVETSKDDTLHFKYVHSKEYQDVQFEFIDIVNSFNNENLHRLIGDKQLNVDALITYSDFCKISEEVVMAREYIERALYVLERFFHPLFSLTTGKCRLPYKYPENRCLFLCLYKHMHFVSRRGCNRTALELAKVMFSLDPKDDPLGALLLLDQYALNCAEYSFITKSMDEWGSVRNLDQLPNWAFSTALAYFHLETKSTDESIRRSDQLLQDALLRFPTVLLKLLEKCSIQPDEKVSSSEYFNKAANNSTSASLNLLCHMYVERCHSSWKESPVMTWLERNVADVIAKIETKEDEEKIKSYTKKRRKCYQKAPLSIYRHAMLSELPGVTSYIPIEIRSQTMLGHDPLPPPDTVTSYTRSHTRRNATAVGGQSRNPISLFFNSLLPGFEAEVELEGDNVVAVGEHHQQLRAGVRDLMEAMRDLFVIPHHQPDEEDEEEVPFEDWE